MAKDTPTIELPRLPDESARAYAARVEYVTMGAGRSIEKLADQRRIKGGSKAITPLREWSVRYGWQESARKYDEDVAHLTVQEAQEQYRADLAAHRKESMEAGKALFTVASQLTIAINQALAGPHQIEGKDGKKYTLHKIELSANTFQIAAKAMQTALDLKAHALGVDVILGKLDDDSE